jgi:uncharacterized protein
MTRRLTIAWPDDRLFADRAGRPVRVLAVSDDIDPALERTENQAALGRLDLVLGCGDLEPDYLAMLADAFRAPLMYVRGNHDYGAGWQEHGQELPEPLPDAHVERGAGLRLVGLSWPGGTTAHQRRDDRSAWVQAIRTAAGQVLRRGPMLVLSHAPPAGAGDDPKDPYHAGFTAYRWLAERLRPPLWLHGHTTLATADSWKCHLGGTTLVNVTGAVLIDLWAPGRDGTDEPDRQDAAAPTV